MQLGAKLHRKIQRQMGADYHAEVTLKRVIPFEEFDIQVEGRADGVIDGEDGVWIDEIKGVFKELDSLKEPIAVHLAQAKCYACIYAEKQGLAQIGVQMTYCNMETEEVRRFREEYQTHELEEWFLELVAEI